MMDGDLPFTSWEENNLVWSVYTVSRLRLGPGNHTCAWLSQHLWSTLCCLHWCCLPNLAVMHGLVGHILYVTQHNTEILSKYCVCNIPGGAPLL